MEQISNHEFSVWKPRNAAGIGKSKNGREKKQSNHNRMRQKSDWENEELWQAVNPDTFFFIFHSVSFNFFVFVVISQVFLFRWLCLCAYARHKTHEKINATKNVPQLQQSIAMIREYLIWKASYSHFSQVIPTYAICHCIENKCVYSMLRSFCPSIYFYLRKYLNQFYYGKLLDVLKKKTWHRSNNRAWKSKTLRRQL